MTNRGALLTYVTQILTCCPARLSLPMLTAAILLVSFETISLRHSQSKPLCSEPIWCTSQENHIKIIATSCAHQPIVTNVRPSEADHIVL